MHIKPRQPRQPFVEVDIPALAGGIGGGVDMGVMSVGIIDEVNCSLVIVQRD